MDIAVRTKIIKLDQRRRRLKEEINNARRNYRRINGTEFYLPRKRTIPGNSIFFPIEELVNVFVWLIECCMSWLLFKLGKKIKLIAASRKIKRLSTRIGRTCSRLKEVNSRYEGTSLSSFVSEMKEVMAGWDEY